MGFEFTGRSSGATQLFDMTNPRSPVLLRTMHEPTNWVWGVDVSPDGTRLAVGSSDSNVWVYNVTTRMTLFS